MGNIIFGPISWPAAIREGEELLRHVIRVATIYFMLLTVLVSPHIIFADYGSQRDQLLQRIQDLASRLQPLSSDGMDTSKVEEYLSAAIQLLNEGCSSEECVSRANELLSAAEREIILLENSRNGYVLWRNIAIWGTVVALASIPLLIYIFLPKIWAFAWYVSRKDWTVLEAKAGNRKGREESSS